MGFFHVGGQGQYKSETSTSHNFLVEPKLIFFRPATRKTNRFLTVTGELLISCRVSLLIEVILPEVLDHRQIIPNGEIR
jgi:hypothetical protein